MATATEALNAASAGIEDIPEESRNDARRREGEVSPRKLSSDTGGLMDSMTMHAQMDRTNDMVMVIVQCSRLCATVH